jgi:two-component system sensor histidine kinase/response regulator
VKSALDRLCGDEPLLKSLLQQFAKRFRKIPDEILAAQEGRDFAEVRRLVHSLKGVAGNLSATDLHQAAKNLEEALEETDKESFQRLFDHLEKTLKLVVQAIDSFGPMSQPEAEDRDELADESTTSMSVDLPSILGKLSQLLQSHDTESFHVVRRLEMVLSPRGSVGPLTDLRTCLERFDFQGARNELAKLARMIDVELDQGKG